MRQSRPTSTPPRGLPPFEPNTFIGAGPKWRLVAVAVGVVISVVPGLLVTDQPVALLVVFGLGAATFVILLQPGLRPWWERTSEYFTITAISAGSWFSGRGDSPLRLMLVIPIVYSAMVHGPRRITTTAVLATLARLLLESGSGLSTYNVANVLMEVGIAAMLGLAIYLLRLYLQRTRDDLFELAEDMSFVRETGRVHLHARRRFERFAESAPVGIYLLRLQPGPNFEYVNPALERISGLTRDQFEADPTAGVDRLVDGAPDRLRTARRSLETWTEPVRVKQQNPDGEVRWHDIREFPFEDEDGKVVGVQGIVDEVTDIVGAQEKLAESLAREQEAVRDLTQTNEMKDVFLQSVSHELRTPLASIIGFSETLVLRPEGMDQDRRDLMLERLLSNAHRLHRLLTDLLDVDRLGRGVLSIDTEDVELADLVRRSVAGLDGSDRVILELVTATVAADAPKLERVIENLVANGLRHGGRAASVWVKVTPESWGARLIVEDNGPGIPANLRDTITEPFVQGPGSLSSSRPGTGIGLTLVNKFVELHRGRLTIGDRDGGGAQLTVDLRLTPETELPRPDSAQGTGQVVA